MSGCLTFTEWTGNIQVPNTRHTRDCTCRDENESEEAA